MTLSEAIEFAAAAQWNGQYNLFHLVHEGKTYSGLTETELATNLYAERSDECWPDNDEEIGGDGEGEAMKEEYDHPVTPEGDQPGNDGPEPEVVQWQDVYEKGQGYGHTLVVRYNGVTYRIEDDTDSIVVNADVEGGDPATAASLARKFKMGTSDWTHGLDPALELKQPGWIKYDKFPVQVWDGGGVEFSHLAEGTVWSDGKASGAACMGDGEGEASEESAENKTLDSGGKSNGGEGVASGPEGFKNAVLDAQSGGEYGGNKTDVHERWNFQPNTLKEDCSSTVGACLPAAMAAKLDANKDGEAPPIYEVAEAESWLKPDVRKRLAEARTPEQQKLDEAAPVVKESEFVNDEGEEEYDFYDGDKVILKDPYGGRAEGIFTLSQWDGNRGWIGDKDGRGWSVRGYQIEPAPEEEEDNENFYGEDESCDECGAECRGTYCSANCQEKGQRGLEPGFRESNDFGGKKAAPFGSEDSDGDNDGSTDSDDDSDDSSDDDSSDDDSDSGKPWESTVDAFSALLEGRRETCSCPECGTGLTDAESTAPCPECGYDGEDDE